MSDRRECTHRWASYFGPVLMCQKCGATTMVAAAPGESKPIFAPLEASNPKADVAPASGAHVQRVVGQTESQETP